MERAVRSGSQKVKTSYILLDNRRIMIVFQGNWAPISSSFHIKLHLLAYKVFCMTSADLLHSCVYIIVRFVRKACLT